MDINNNICGIENKKDHSDVLVKMRLDNLYR